MSRRRGALALLTAAAVAAGMVTAVGTAAAEPSTAVVPQSCQFPLIGASAVEVRADVDLPEALELGQSTPATTAPFTITLSELTTQAFQLVGASTVNGTVTLPITTAYSDGRSSTRDHTITVDGTAVPTGNSTITWTGTAPIDPVTAAEPAFVTWRVEPVRMNLRPLTPDGNETGLGFFDVTCSISPTTDPTLATTSFGGGTPPVGSGVAHTCPIPLVGDQVGYLKPEVSLPAELPAGVFTPPADVAVTLTFPRTFTHTMELIGAKTVNGELRLPITRSFNGAVVETAESKVRITGATVPAATEPTVLTGTFTLPQATSEHPGTVSWEQAGLAMTLTPLLADGTETGLGTVDSACTTVPGQPTRFGSVVFTGGNDAPPVLQNCPMPLIGTQPLQQRTSVDLPEELQVGIPTPATDLRSSVTFPDAFTTAMGLVGATRLRGNLWVTTDSTFNGGAPTSHDYYVPFTDVPIPAGSTPFTATGTALFEPSTSDVPGTLTHRVGELKLTLTPLKADGTETGLGTFDTTCGQAPNQNTFLDSVRFVPAGDGPNQRCPFPLIGVQQVDLLTSVDLPRELKVGELTPAREFTSDIVFPADTAQGLLLVGTARLRGEVRIPVTRSFNGSPVTTDTYKVPFEVAGPTSVEPFTVTVKAALARATSTVPGVVDWRTGALSFTLTPLTADGGETGLGTFDSRCTAVPGKDTGFGEVAFVAAPDRPTPPTAVTAHDITSTSVRLTWNPATGARPITGYDVYSGETVVAGSGTPGVTVTGLAPATEYTFTVRAEDQAGEVSLPSAPVVVRTLPPDADEKRLDFGLSGTSRLKAANTSVTLLGSTTGTLIPSSGKVTADTAFDPTTVSLRYAGLIPATAVLNLVPTGKTTGTLTGGVLSTVTVVNVKLPVVLIFGIPVHQSTTCGATAPSTLDLKSGPGFTPAAGGTVQGTYSVAKIAGCGSYTSWLSGALSGPGNTARLTLTPKV